MGDKNKDSITAKDIEEVSALFGKQIPVEEMYLIVTEKCIIENWDDIQRDYYSGYEDIKSPYEFIYKAKKGEIKYMGMLIQICYELPKFK